MLTCRLVRVITASDAHVEEAFVENLLCLTSACVCCGGAYSCWQCADFHAVGSVLFVEHVQNSRSSSHAALHVACLLHVQHKLGHVTAPYLHAVPCNA